MILQYKKIKKNRQAGMTYVELIVVLSIFAIMSTVLLFKYSTFTDQIDLQNLSQDIALQIVGAQKDALSGVLPAIDGGAGHDIVASDWKPSYGVYFNATVGSSVDDQPNKKIIPFIDADNSKFYFENESCDPTSPTITSSECRDLISIGKGDYVRSICFTPTTSTSSTDCILAHSISITFTRPDSSAFFVVEPTILDPNNLTNQATKVVITIASERDANLTKEISVYASGRIEVN